MNPFPLAAATIPALVAFALIALLRRSAIARALADHPNERSLHGEPRPRVGGIGVLAGALPVAFVLADGTLRVALALALALGVLSLIDDRRSLPIAVRLTGHAAAAVAVALVSMDAFPGLVIAAAALAIAWMTNLYNFMDGADGLAGGMGTIGFGALGAGAAAAGDGALAWTCVALASACVGFLAHNFPPARVFMGDAGSIPLGFLAGALGAAGVARGAWPAWFPALAFAPFILDASLTLVRRALRGEPFWRAHRTHLYQRLVLSGWSHRRLALGSYALMSVSAACAFLALRQGGMLRSVIISGWTVAFVLLFAALERRLARAPRESLPGPDR